MIARLRGRLDWRAEHGVTLVEVLVACVLLAGGIAATSSVFANVFGTQTASEKLDLGVEVGARVLEDLRALPFAQVAVSASPAFPAAAGASHPAQRLGGGGTTYTPPGGSAEELVAKSPSAAYPDYEIQTVGTQRFAIFRFVSWRDEECPIVDLTALDTALGDLRALLTTTNASLTALVGPGGSITGTLADGNGLLGGGSLLGGLLAPLLSAVTGVVGVLNPINAALTPLLAPLQGTLTALNGLLDPVTGRLKDTIDLCDLPTGTVPSVADVAALNATLTALTPVLAAVAPLVQHVGGLVHSLVNLNLLGLLAAVVQAPLIVADTVSLTVQGNALTTILGGVTTTLGNPISLVNLATGLTANLQGVLAFLTSPDTTHNTKRVSVAVQLLNPSTGHGPKAPVWVSTVITDPTDGLL